MRRNFWVRIRLAFCLVAGSYLPLCAEEQERAREMLLHCSAALREIKSLQCDESRVALSELKGEKRRGGDAVRLTLHGEKFRAEYFNNLATPQGEPSTIQSYDGVKFFHYLQDADSLVVHAKPTSNSMTPSAYATLFHWVCETEAKRTWPNLLNKATWEEAARRARIVGPLKDRDWQCEVLEFKAQVNKDVQLTYRVCLARDLDFFPTKCEMLKDEELLANTTLEKHGKVKLGAQTLIVPLEVRHRQSKPIVQEADYYLAGDSLRINQPIDEKRFTLSAIGISNVLEKE